MTDRTRPEDEDAEDEAGSPDIVRQRQRIKELEDENKTLREATKRHAFIEAGFDPEKGEGKLLYETYRGERDKAAVLEWADKEYGIKPSVREEAAAAPPARTEAEQREVAFEARLARAAQEATTVDSDQMAAALAEARKRGDVKAEIALMMAQWEQTKT